jgi:hypothetical protein
MKEIPFVLMYKGQNLEASTINYSREGMNIKIFGKPSLPVGEIMELNIGDSVLKTQIAWLYSSPEISLTVSGLKILEGSLRAA